MPCASLAQPSSPLANAGIQTKNTTRVHLFYSENLEAIKVALVPLYDCTKWLFKTTYFDNNAQHFYDAFTCMLRPRMKVLDSKRSVYHDFKESKHVAVTPIALKHLLLQYWQTWTYESHQATVRPSQATIKLESTVGSSGISSNASRSLVAESSSSANEVVNIQDAHKLDGTIAGWVEALPTTIADLEQRNVGRTCKYQPVV